MKGTSRLRGWLALAAMLCGPSALAKGPKGGGEESATNNLSYPAVFTGTAATLTGTPGEWSLAGVFPTSKSYGCAKPEVVEHTTYPNTSCVSATGVPLTYDECVAGPCAGYPVEGVYWQKSGSNQWQAQTLGPNLEPQYVAYLDWGDNLESVSWKTSSVIRVETTPFGEATDGSTLMGFQMWHVSGQGPSEMWGVRATSATSQDPFVYDSPYHILHTPAARLNITKLVDGPAECPTEGGVEPPVPAGISWKRGVLPGGWTTPAGDLYVLRDIPYTVELNIGGKFVYGFNWMMQRDSVPTSVGKAGWWRLTFYTANNVDALSDPVVFDDPAIPTAPPVLPDGHEPVVTAEEDTGPLYMPRVDAANNLTYIDICVVEGRSGGQKGGPR